MPPSTRHLCVLLYYSNFRHLHLILQMRNLRKINNFKKLIQNPSMLWIGRRKGQPCEGNFLKMDYGNEPRFPAWVSKSTKKIHTSAGAGESLQQYVRKICNMGMVCWSQSFKALGIELIWISKYILQPGWYSLCWKIIHRTGIFVPILFI